MKRRIVLPFLAVALSFLVSCNNDDDDVVEPDSPVDYPAEVQNDYPIVLAHGMCGWGRDEMNGFHYWGGTGDIQEYLKEQGFTVFTASYGPLSSNWDRAVELYYYIKGGTVDYGAVHAMRHGHDRYGKTYPGAYPQWNETNKVHIIGHSMGGPTPRFLIELLENGDAQEQAFVPQPDEKETSELFKGGKRWVHSHTSIAGVHNGALPADFVDYRDELLKIVLGAGAIGGIVLEENAVYDFDLGQWGLQRKDGETPSEYIDRVFGKSRDVDGSASRFWQSTDNCLYDLSVEASQLQNAWVKSSANVYYASYAINGTTKNESTGVCTPLETMSPLVIVEGKKIGETTADLPFGFQAWRPNDGLVSVPSAQYPVGHKYAMMDPADRKLQPKGVWDAHPVISGPDHLSIVIPDGKQTALDPGKTGLLNLYQFYLQIANDLVRLPQ